VTACIYIHTRARERERERAGVFRWEYGNPTELKKMQSALVTYSPPHPEKQKNH